jgi:DNA-binding transcriptional LysR family regulator
MAFRRGHLLYFVTVAQEGQITRAARRLHLAQPALSQAIAQLEADLGLELFERHARGVTLTPAGETFIVKAQAATSAWEEAVATARSFARAGQGTIEFGFLGSPPGLDSPGPLAAFAAAHPDIDVLYRELPFPSSPTARWLSEVDVAVCHLPPTDPDVWVQELRREPRVVLAPRRHPLAARRELCVAEILDSTFIGFHPSVEPAWAGFWSLDDHRGRRPPDTTADRALNPQEVLASLAVRNAITTVPASVVKVLQGALGDLVAIPLSDAAPANIVLAGAERRRNPLVGAMLEFARHASAQP